MQSRFYPNDDRPLIHPEVKEKKPRGKKVVRFVHAFILIAFCAVNIYYSWKAYNTILETTADAIDIGVNWQTGAILDLKVEEVCPEGYEEAFNFTWPGTNPGCSCRNVPVDKKMQYGFLSAPDVSPKPCSNNQTLAGCANVPAFNPVNISSYTSLYDPIKGDKIAKLCVQRSTETWADVAPKSGNVCDEPDTIQCGSSEEEIFCTKESYCPIGAIEVQEINLDLDSLSLASCILSDGCLVLQRNDTSAKVLKYQRTDQVDTLPIVQFKLNEYGMCEDIFQDNVTPNRKEFPLLKSFRSTCWLEGKKMWDQLDNFTESQLFANSGMENINAQLIRYGYYEKGRSGDDYIWGAFTRDYIPWNIDCRDRMDQFIQTSESFKSIERVQYTYFLMSCGIGLFLGVIIAILIALGLYKGCTTFFNYACKIALAGVLIYTIFLLHKVGNFYSDIVASDCTSAQYSPYIVQIAQDVKNAKLFNYICAAALAVAFLFDILVLACVRTTKQSHVQSPTYASQRGVEMGHMY